MAFSNLDYSRFRSSLYSCYLEGYDDEWSVPMESGEVLYRNLPPGDYCLKVRSCNSSGIWCSDYASFRFTIRQPFYLTWWAWCIYAVLLAVAVVSAYTVTRKILRLKQKVKLEQELSAFKLRFSYRWSTTYASLLSAFTILLVVCRQATNRPKLSEVRLRRCVQYFRACLLSTAMRRMQI